MYKVKDTAARTNVLHSCCLFFTRDKILQVSCFVSNSQGLIHKKCAHWLIQEHFNPNSCNLAMAMLSLHRECTKAKCQMPVVFSAASIVSQNRIGIGITIHKEVEWWMLPSHWQGRICQEQSTDCKLFRSRKRRKLRCHNADIGHTNQHGFRSHSHANCGCR